MQVYRAYFKVIRKHLSSMIIYFGIFMFIALMITNALQGYSSGAFTETRTKIAFLSEEKGSALVDGLRDYLAHKVEIINVADNDESIQDALFYGEVEYVLRVPQGFAQSFMSGKNDADLQKIVKAQSAGSFGLDLLINRYLDLAQLYVKNVPDVTEGEIVRNVGRDLSASAVIDFNTYDMPSDTNALSYYFQYIAYAILAIIIMGITSIMMAFNKTDLSNRNMCSPMSTVRMNLQIVLGNATFALVVWAGVCAVIFNLYGKVTLNAGVVLLCINALAFTIASLGIGFLAGKFVKSPGAQSAITNVISLGISFISGVFVARELLGKSVLNIASFTPGYWYEKAVSDIRGMVEFSAGNIAPVIYSILIQLGFAAAFIIIALLFTKQKKNSMTN